MPHPVRLEAKDRVLKTGVVFCQYPEGVRFGEEEDDIARLVIGIAARNNEHIQVITSLTNALDDESVIEASGTPPAWMKCWNCWQVVVIQSTLSTWRRWG